MDGGGRKGGRRLGRREKGSGIPRRADSRRRRKVAGFGGWGGRKWWEAVGSGGIPSGIYAPFLRLLWAEPRGIRGVSWRGGGGKAQTLISSGVGPWAMCRVGLGGLHSKVTDVPKA